MLQMSADTVLLIAGAFVAAGMVKGVIGLGLPTVSLAFLAATLGLKEAMALMLIPAFATNVWQGLSGRDLPALLRRLWPLLLAACAGIWLGAGLLARADGALVTGLFGLLLCFYAAISLVTPQIPPPGRWERMLSPVMGGLGGLATGVTGSFAFPGVLYLQALGLPRDTLVQAMGIVFTVISVALFIGLAGHGLMPVHLGVLSTLAIAPAVAGMVLGRRIRRGLPEDRFRRVFFGGLFLLGAYIALRAFL